VTKALGIRDRVLNQEAFELERNLRCIKELLEDRRRTPQESSSPLLAEVVVVVVGHLVDHLQLLLLC
jgi:hypothetical protein